MAAVAARPFASGTSVPAEKSQKAMYDALDKHGASRIMTFDDKENGYSLIAFEIPAPIGGKLSFALHLPLPDPKLFPLNAATTGNAAQRSRFSSQYDKEKARLWRVSLNLIVSKLVAIQEGATTTEREFFADQVIVNENGKQTTVYQWFSPQLEHLRKTGGQPRVLPAIEHPKLIRSIQD